MIREFSPDCLDRLGYYVYALLEPGPHPWPQRLFYIGKGRGNRCFAHLAEADLDGEAAEREKILAIRRIMQEHGRDPEIRVVAHGLREDEAFALESTLIELHRPLGNRVSGHGARDLWLSTNEIVQRYGAPLTGSRTPSNGLARVALVSLNGGENLPAYPEFADDDATLLERTTGYWKLNVSNARSVEFVVGVYQGLTRCVYRVRDGRAGESMPASIVGLPGFSRLPGSWTNLAAYRGPSRSEKTKVTRVRFFGDRDPSLEAGWVSRRVAVDGENFTTFGQNPVRLVWLPLAAA